MPIDRHLYRISSRNLKLAVFDGEGFVGIREKLGSYFLDKEYPRGSGSYGTVTVIEDLGEIPNHLVTSQYLRHEHGNLWLDRDGVPTPVRSVEFTNESGFVERVEDYWADTNEPIPQGKGHYPKLKQNRELFNWLQEKEKEYT